MITIPQDLQKLLQDDGYIVVSPEITQHDDRLFLKKQTGISRNDSPAAMGVLTDLAEKVPDRRSADVAAMRSVEFDIPTIVQYIKWHMNRISENVIGRSEIVKQAFFAILTGEHMLLLSRTGMAKSYLTNYIYGAFEGARIFSSQASKDQTPDNYFGPYNIDEFRKGRIRHNIKGSIIEANLVFLDEFFDASDVVLRSLLTVLNERSFINGSEQIDAAVHTAIATANYMRMNEVTEAVLDRFMYKAIIPEDKNVYRQLLIDHTYQWSGGKPVDSEKKIFFNQILFLSDIIKNRNKDIKIETPDIAYFMKNIIINRFMGEMRKNDHNFFLSPRKIAKVGDFLRASAMLANRNVVNEEDIKEMYLALCTLNSYVSVKARDKLEVDVFRDTYQQMMVHFNASGAIPQIEYLLNVRRIFQDIRQDPEKREHILAKRGFINSVKELVKKIFPNRRDDEDLSVTVQSLKKGVVDINPAVEEVAELKDGIIKDYVDIY
jgi:MoxR-like ATPase